MTRGRSPTRCLLPNEVQHRFKITECGRCICPQLSLTDAEVIKHGICKGADSQLAPSQDNLITRILAAKISQKWYVHRHFCQGRACLKAGALSGWSGAQNNQLGPHENERWKAHLVPLLHGRRRGCWRRQSGRASQI